MVHLPGLPRVGAEVELVQALQCAEGIQDVNVCLNVIGVVAVGWILFDLPLPRQPPSRGELPARGCALVVDGVEAADIRQKLRHVRMCRRVQRSLEHRSEDVLEHLAEVRELLHAPVEAEQPRDLNHPTKVRGEQRLAAAQPLPTAENPTAQILPFVALAAVNAQAPLDMLVLGLLQIVDELLCELGKIPASDSVVCLQEDVAQLVLAHRGILVVEAVEPVLATLVCPHLQAIQRQPLPCDAQTLENRSQRALLAGARRINHIMRELLQLLLHEAEQVLRVHRRRVVHMRVHLADIVEVTVADFRNLVRLLLAAQHAVQLETSLHQA
mmetsp:Transcript_134093/g.388139  ORF Transcript_134093/g.388139 Transcript_134093/m.388139 type:complete len:327 (+) Transcript_134093:967-1947(+)